MKPGAVLIWTDNETGLDDVAPIDAMTIVDGAMLVELTDRRWICMSGTPEMLASLQAKNDELILIRIRGRPPVFGRK